MPFIPKCIDCNKYGSVVPIVYCYGRISKSKIEAAKKGKIKLMKNRFPVEDFYCKNCRKPLAGEEKMTKKKETYL